MFERSICQCLSLRMQLSPIKSNVSLIFGCFAFFAHFYNIASFLYVVSVCREREGEGKGKGKKRKEKKTDGKRRKEKDREEKTTTPGISGGKTHEHRQFHLSVKIAINPAFMCLLVPISYRVTPFTNFYGTRDYFSGWQK